MRTVTLFLMLLCVVAGAGEAQVPTALRKALEALPAEVAPIEIRASDTGCYFALLPNGCEIVVKEKRNAPVVAVQAWVRTGAIHEGPWMGAGLSHFCEHMLFKGTTKRPTGVLDQEIRGGGGDDNAYTTNDRTVYHITTESKGFNSAFSALADMLMDSTFPPDETVKEHAVVVKEIELYKDSPDGVLWDTVQRTVYSTHPYNVPVLGYPDRFKRVTREEVFAYYKARYAPQLCTFLIVGDVDSAKVMPEMAKVLGAWTRTSVLPVAIEPEPLQVAPRKVDLTHPACEVPKFVLAFPTVAMRSPDVYALDILATIAGDGRTSRLYRELKDKQQLAVDVSAFNYTPLYTGYFAIAAQADDTKLDAARTAALAVLESFKTVPPTAEELARAKRKVKAHHIQGQMTAEGLAERIGTDWFTAGDLDFSERYTERMQKVTADDIVRVAKEYFPAEKLTTVIVRPVPKVGVIPSPQLIALDCEEATIQVGKLVAYAEGIVAASEGGGALPGHRAETKKNVAALEHAFDLLKKDPNIADAKLDVARGIFSFTLKPSGVRVVVRDDDSLPVVNATVAALGGLRWEPADKGGAANLLAKMLERGTTQRDAQQVAIAAEDVGAKLESFSGKNAFGVQINGLSDDTEALLKLGVECMLQPRFDEAEFEKVRDDVLQAIEQEDESLFGLNSKVLRPLLYGKHPYARTLLGTKESVAAVKIADLKTLHAAWVQPENLAISIVGNVRATDAAKWLAPLVGKLPNGTFKALALEAPEALKGIKEGQMDKDGITGAVLTLGFSGAGLKDADRDSLDIIAALLSGMGGRLNTELREKQGLGYAVGAHNESQLDGGSMVLFIQTDPQGLEKSLKGMQGEAAKLRDVSVEVKELENVKNYLTGTEAIGLQNQSDLAQRLALAVLYGEGFEVVFNRRERLEKIDAAQIQAAAKKYFSTERWARAIVKPKEPAK